jgi:predicted amidophosphoribosyltransferase
VRVSFGSFFADRRGDKLASYRVVRNGSGTYFVLLRGSEAAAQQIEACESCTRRRVPLPLAVEFTHCLRLNEAPSAALKELLNLLGNVVTLPKEDALDCALALDFYKDPTSHEDPMSWSNTPAGELVHRAKYRGETDAGTRLATALADVISRHPLYQSVDAILCVPGHKKGVTSFGVRLAAAVAKRVEKPFFETKARSSERPPAKEIGQQDASTLRRDFRVPSDVVGNSVIIVDDVIRSGTSMRAVAESARDAGARSVLGLAGVRTMRR